VRYNKTTAQKNSDLIPADYAAWLAELKVLIRTARVKASLAVNRELIQFYWRIANEILARQETQGWGAKVIDQLAQDLRREFSHMKGLSPRTMKYMRAFAEAWPDESFVQLAAAQMPWFHNCVVMDKIKDRQTRSLTFAKRRDAAARAPNRKVDCEPCRPR
jgi:predicted nuclease of restriction endonuclease-like (RecB) superfamily